MRAIAASDAEGIRMTAQKADYLVEKAELCLRLARDAERGHTSVTDLSKLLSDGHEMMAKAVELDTARDRASKSGKMS